MLIDTKEILRTLRQNHLTILHTIDDITKTTTSGQVFTRKDYLTARPGLRDLQNSILNHLQKQNDSFYHDLESSDLLSSEEQKNIRFLKEDLRGFKVKTLLFFDEHPADMGDVNPKNFKRDFSDYLQELMARVRHEEEFLMPIIEKIAV